MANYQTVLLQPTFQLYTHNSSAASAFVNYPGITRVSTVNPSNPASVRSWTPDLPVDFQLTWLTSFTPGSSYQVVLSANASVAQEGSYPGITIRPIVGPFAFLSMPANSLPINILTATVTNSAGTVPLSSVLGFAWTVVIDNSSALYPAFNSWKRYDQSDIGSFNQANTLTYLYPNSSYYIALGNSSSFTINIPRRNNYLITNDARFITTNNGNYIVVSSNP
jgi:hypothetical protein